LTVKTKLITFQVRMRRIESPCLRIHIYSLQYIKRAKSKRLSFTYAITLL
jgi:hypothetical protein